MARTALAISTLSTNSALNASSTAVDPTNGHSITGDLSRGHFILVNNTAVAAKNVTIKAGVSPPSIRKGLGDLVFSVPASSSRIVRIETARFTQADGTINIDLEAAITGVITVVAFN